MFPQEAVAESTDHVLNTRFALRLEYEITFSIKAHGTIVEVGRADPQQFVINDDDLGVHVDTLIVETRHLWPVEAQAVVTVGIEQLLEHTLSQYVHCALR